MADTDNKEKDQDKPQKLKTIDKIWVAVAIILFLVAFALIILYGALIF
jgi:hypothetical protein